MSALQNIRKGLSSTGSSIIVAVLIFGLVATFGGFLTDPSAPSNSPLKINGKKEVFLSGGRFDNLIKDLGNKKDSNAVGAAINRSIL